MTTQAEATMENNLIKLLLELGYASVKIANSEALLSNLKTQLEIFNTSSFSAKEFDAISASLGKRQCV